MVIIDGMLFDIIILVQVIYQSYTIFLVIKKCLNDLEPLAQGQTLRTACFVNQFHWNTATPIPLCIIAGSFHAAMAEVSGIHKD